MLDLWPEGKRPAECKSGICEAIRDEAPGDYEIVLLCENMETLVEAACRALGRDAPSVKSRDERDRILQRLAFEGTRDQRVVPRDEVDGFERLVTWTARLLKEHGS